MVTLESILLYVSILIFVSVVSSRISDRFAMPVLLLFLGVGMIAGSEGIGAINFDNMQLAKSFGILALIFIIFSGGIDTDWRETRPVVWPGVMLSTIGVLLTAVITGACAVAILKCSLLEGLLLGSIVSSTDAAAVFSTLRSKRISLKPPLKPLLELESGSNDPMAVFLTVGLISMLTEQGTDPAGLVVRFFLDMGIGALTGYLMARFITFFMNRFKLDYEGLYPVIMIAFVLMTYALAFFVKGNGFLAVYLVGLMLGQAEFPNKKMIMRFHDGIAWLMQIMMFVMLGLLVFPSRIVPFMGAGLLLTLCLMLVARPLSVWLCLAPFRLEPRKKAMVAWVGLRGAVPIILATFPFMAGIPQADTIFNIAFFVVISSVFIQGASIPVVSRMLRLDEPFADRVKYPLEFEKTAAMDADLKDIIVPYNAEAVGKRISDLGLSDRCLIVLISREGRFIVPSGPTVIEGGDILLVLANEENFFDLQQTIQRIRKDPADPGSSVLTA